MYYSYFHTLQRVTRYLRSCFLALALICSLSVYSHAQNTLESEGEKYRVLGYEAQQRGDLQKALNFYAKAISLGVETAAVYNDLGVLYEQLGVINRAEESYLKALSIDADYLPPYTNLAYLYKEQSRNAEAVMYFQHRLERCDESDPWRGLIVEELKVLDPSYKKKMIAAQLADVGKRLEQEKRDALTLDVSRAENHFRAGNVFADEKQYDKALMEFDRALTLTPKSSKILKAKQEVLYQKSLDEVKQHTHKAMEFLDEEEVESAQQELQRALAVIPNRPLQEGSE